MTVPHHTSPLAAPSVEAAVALLRARGLRVSSARRLVIEALITLEEIGLVRHFHAGHGPGRYALAATAEVDFVTCERCGALEAVPAAQLDAARAAIERATGYRARFSHFPIVGTCAACLTIPTQEPHRHAHP